jgi:flagellar protein FlaG
MIVQAPNIEQGNGSPAQRSGNTPAPDVPAASPVATRAATASPAESAESLRAAVAAINRAAKSLNNSVQLSLDARSGRAIVRVVDTETGQLIRQIPTEEILELRRALDRIAGMLINQTA